MRHLPLLLAFLAFIVAGTGYIRASAPFEEDNSARIVFASSDAIVRMCASSRAIACMLELGGEKVIYAPNPCGFPPGDGYAHTLCHELKHVNGLPKEQPAAAPKHGFVCTPTITPRIAAARRTELA